MRVVQRIILLVAALMAVLFIMTSCTAQHVGQPAAPNADNQNAKNAEEKLLVYTSFYPIYDFTSQIGGHRIEPVALIEGGNEPHTWEPDAVDFVGLEKADIFIYNGAGMEPWADKVLAALENQSLMVVDTSNGIDLIAAGHHHHGDEDGHHEDEHTHEHESYDPHIWLSLRNAKQQCETIKQVLSQADPEYADYYQQNYDRYAAQLDELDAEYEQTLQSITNRNLVVSHEAFAYLCRDYGLTQMAVEGLTPDSEPDAARMVEIIKFCKENHVTTIFFEELASQKVADAIAKAAGVEVGMLTTEQSTNREGYLAFMRTNLQVLAEGLK